MNAANFGQLNKGLINRFYLPADFKNTRAHLDNDAIRFDKLFQTTKNTVAYAACVIESPQEQELVMVSGADDGMKVWLNGKMLLKTRLNEAPSGNPSYGDLGKSRNFTSLPLLKGANFLLVKVSQIDRMWGFNCTLLNLEEARKRSQSNQLYLRDVVERNILRREVPLKLDAEFENLLRTLKLPAKVEILNAKRQPVSSEEIDYRRGWSKSLAGNEEGIYFCRVTCPLYVLEEPFYYGDAQSQLSIFQQKFSRLNADEKAKINFETLQVRWTSLLESADKQSEKKDWQRKLVYLIGEFDSLLAHVPTGMNYPGTHLRGFRSRIDDQIQYYMVHVPEKTRAPMPLVVFAPFPLPDVPFLKSVHVTNTPLIDNYVKWADRYGYVLLWPFARGNPDAAPIAMTDIFEAMEAARSDYKLDSERTYLTGWSYGGTCALLMGQRWPGVFAAIAAIMPPTDLVAFEDNADRTHSRYPISWLKLNSPIELVDSLSNTPLYIIHGAEDQNVAPAQSQNFVEKCRRLGMEIKFEIIPGMDHVYSPIDLTGRVFEFFKDKVVKRDPERVMLASAQLKYGAAYWLKLDQLTTPNNIGKISAVRTSDTSIDVKTENVSRYEVLLDRLAQGKGKPLSITTNGQPSFSGVPQGTTLQIDVDRTVSSNAVNKNHDIEGPILHAFAEPFVVVEGTAGPSQTGIGLISQRVREMWMKNYFVDCLHKKDSEVTEQDIENKNLVLLGTPETNSLVKKVISEMPVRFEPGQIRLGDRQYSGNNLCTVLIYPNPLNRKKYVIVMAANNDAGYEMMASNLSQNAWYDFAVWNPDAPQGAKRVAAGYWDVTWQKTEDVSGPR